MATKWACVGPGAISTDFFTAIKNCLPEKDHELVAVASKDLAKAQKFAADFQFEKAYGSYDQLAQDTDVGRSIKLYTSEDLAKAKKFAADFQFEKAYGSYDKLAQNLDVDLPALLPRWLPAYQQIQQELETCTLGDVKLVQANFCVSAVAYDQQRILTASLGGGGAVDIGIYAINLACIVFKEMPESITAVGHLSEAGDVDRGGCIILKYKNGAMANLTYHIDTANGNWSAHIMGTKASIQIDQPFNIPDKIKTPAGTQEFKYGPGKYTFDNSAGLAYEAAAMRKTILSGKLEAEACTLADSEMIMTILDEVRRQIGMKYPDFD